MLKCSKLLTCSKTACNNRFLFSMCSRQAVRQLQRGVVVYFLLPPPPPASMVATRMKMFSVSVQIPMHLANRKSKLVLLNRNSVIWHFTPLYFTSKNLLEASITKPNYDCPQCQKKPCIFVLPSQELFTEALTDSTLFSHSTPPDFMLYFYLFIFKNFEEGQHYSILRNQNQGGKQIT